MKRILLFLFVFLSINLSAATLTATQSGNWSDASTWGGTAPTGSADVVTIGPGFTVTLTGATAASTLVLNGTLNDAGFILTLSKTNSTVLSTTSGGTHSGTGSITLTGNKLIKIAASNGSTLILGNLIINQSAAASGYNNICEIGSGTVSITGTLTLNNSGVFALNTKTVILNNPVSSAGYFTGSDIYPGTGVTPITSSNGGTVVPSTGSITLNSSAATIPNPTQLTTLMNLTVNVGSNNTYTLTNPLTIAPNGTSAGNVVITTGTLNTGANALTVNAGGTGVSSIAPGASLVVANSGSVNFNGQPLTIQSDATGTGSIQAVAGTLSGVSNVTAQRYVGTSQQWRMVSFPFTAATTISQTTLSGFYTTNPYAAYTFNEAADNGAYGGSGGTNGGWVNFSTGTITANNGILLNGGSSSTIALPGTLNTGSQSIAITKSAAGWNLVANPFVSNINWTTIASNNSSLVNNAIYRVDPNSGAYVSYVNGSSSNGSQTNVIENGASFFVQAKASGNLQIQESDKTNSTAGAILFGSYGSSTIADGASGGNQSIVRLTVKEDSDNYGDAVVLRWGGGFAATDKFDGKYDAYDLGRIKGANLSVVDNDAVSYSIFHGSELQNSDVEKRTVKLSLTQLTEGSYNISAEQLSPFIAGNIAYLYDCYMHQYTALDASNPSYSFNVTSDAASQAANRFSVVFNAKIVNESALNNSISLLNNPSSGSGFTLYSKENYNIVQWQLVDNVGRTIQIGQLNNVLKGSTYQISTQTILRGVYVIKLLGNSQQLNSLKLVKQ